MPKGDFGGKRNTRGFDKNPKGINKKGPPRKVITDVLEYCKKKYGEKPPKSQVIELLEFVEKLNQKELQDFIKDETVPMVVIAYASLLLSGENKDLRRIQAAEIIQDRLRGRPKQQTEVTNPDGSLTPITKIIIERHDGITIESKPGV